MIDLCTGIDESVKRIKKWLLLVLGSQERRVGYKFWATYLSL